LEILATHACFRPAGKVTLQEGVDSIANAIRFARDNGIRRLFVDITKLTGFSPPTIADRYEFGERFAAEAMGVVKLAMLARGELIHPRRFGLLVGRNRGLWAEVFESEEDALAWLLDRKDPANPV